MRYLDRPLGTNNDWYLLCFTWSIINLWNVVETRRESRQQGGFHEHIL